MKLRNKKDRGLANILGEQDFFRVYTDAGWADYKSLAELNEEWEDYKPLEPLIKDEKIRKAVRVWAETVDRTDLLVIKIGGRLEISDGSPHLIYISFHADEATLKSLDGRTYYTIEELCGEEE